MEVPFCSSVPDPQAVIASMYNSLPAFTAHDRFYDLDMDMNGIFLPLFFKVHSRVKDPSTYLAVGQGVFWPIFWKFF